MENRYREGEERRGDRYGRRKGRERRRIYTGEERRCNKVTEG